MALVLRLKCSFLLYLGNHVLISLGRVGGNAFQLFWGDGVNKGTESEICRSKYIGYACLVTAFVVLPEHTRRMALLIAIVLTTIVHVG